MESRWISTKIPSFSGVVWTPWNPHGIQMESSWTPFKNPINNNSSTFNNLFAGIYFLLLYLINVLQIYITLPFIIDSNNGKHCSVLKSTYNHL